METPQGRTTSKARRKVAKPRKSKPVRTVIEIDDFSPRPEIKELFEATLRDFAKKLAATLAEGLASAEVTIERPRRKAESCYDVARRAGLIGVAKNLPRDLSTNKKYMAGFGES